MFAKLLASKALPAVKPKLKLLLTMSVSSAIVALIIFSVILTPLQVITVMHPNSVSISDLKPVMSVFTLFRSILAVEFTIYILFQGILDEAERLVKAFNPRHFVA